jgi:hypothetical protein
MKIYDTQRQLMLHPFINRPVLGFVLLALIAVMIFFNVRESRAVLCSKWSEGEKIGTLNHLRLDEASGIAVSQRFPGRLYHVNDSGGGPYFYTTDMSGGATRPVRIEGFDSSRSDFEDASIGDCFSGKTCFFVADIGDNNKKRDSVDIIVIEELQNYSRPVAPLKVVRLVYPDHPHNAEGLAIHPNGDIYIFTKEENVDDMKASPAKLFRIKKDKWENAGDGEIMLEYLGELDIPKLTDSDSALESVVTSFDISPDGKRFLILTYTDAFEFDIDLSKSGLKPSAELKEGKDYRVIKLTPLSQQESISYIDGGMGFIYDTEYHFFEVPLMKVECLDRK